MEHKEKNNTGLLQYALAQLGKPYWYGTFGQKASQWLYEYNKGRLQKYYTASDFPKQIAAGQKVHDCIGLVKGYMWCKDANDEKPVYKSNGFPDVSADAQFSRSKRKGYGMASLPEEVGVLVFMPGHVGIYAGDGWVVEARGHAYGVVKTRLKDRPWTRWAYIDEIEYIPKEQDKDLCAKCPYRPKP